MKKDKIKENIINLIGEAGGVDEFVFISNRAITLDIGETPREVREVLIELVEDDVVEICNKRAENGGIYHYYKLKKFLYY